MASGALLCRFGAGANQAPGAGYATPDLRNGVLVLDFDPVTNENAMFVDLLPPNYSGGGVTVKIHWMASTAVSGSTRWLALWERHQRGVDDTDVDSFAPQRGVSTAAVAPSGTEMETVITFTAGAQMDNLVAGERFRLIVGRDANQSGGVDDMAGDAELVHVSVYET